MSRYMEDGGVIPSGVPTSQRRGRTEHMTMFGIYRGIVVKSVYPDEPQNSNGGRMEYTVKVRGQLYPNAINVKEAGGIYNYRERVRKHVEKSFTGKLEEGTYDENLDGEHVYVMFVEGNGNVPLIIGGADHPRRPAYKKAKKADGLFDAEEFNGVEFTIDKDSNYTIKHVGRKDKEGKILNQPAVGSQIKMHGNGDIEFNTHGTQDVNDLWVKFTKAAKKFELHAQNNNVVADTAGIKASDKNGNIVEMKSGGVNVTVNGNVNVTASGNAVVDAGGTGLLKTGGACDVDAGGPVNIKAAGNSINGGVVTDNTANNDPITGIPLTPVGGITTS